MVGLAELTHLLTHMNNKQIAQTTLQKQLLSPLSSGSQVKGKK